MDHKFNFCLVLLSISAIGASQEDLRKRPTWYVSSFIGQSAIVLGSEDIRQGGGFSIAYERPERRFRYGSNGAKLVWEVYADRSHSINHPSSPNTRAYGVLASARWFGNHDARGQGFYFGLGWGLQYADRTSWDLDSKINSTPMLEFGTTFPVMRREFQVGFRYLHASNAGTVGDNQGSNQLYLTVGFRF